MKDKKTSMQIHESTLIELFRFKGKNDTYEDVIRMLLLNYDSSITFENDK